MSLNAMSVPPTGTLTNGDAQGVKNRELDCNMEPLC